MKNGDRKLDAINIGIFRVFLEKMAPQGSQKVSMGRPRGHPATLREAFLVPDGRCQTDLVGAGRPQRAAMRPRGAPRLSEMRFWTENGRNRDAISDRKKMKSMPKLSQCQQSKLQKARQTQHTRRSEKARLVEETRQHATKTRRDGLATHISHDMRCQGEFPTWTPPYLPGESPLTGVR